MSLTTGVWIEKQGKGTFGTKWLRRWMIQEGPFLKYYLSPEHVHPQGQIDFSQVDEVRLSTKGTVGEGNVAMFPFEVVMQANLKRVYCIRTDKEEDRESLVAALQTLLEQCKTGSAPAPEDGEASDTASKEQATLDELNAKVKELSKEIEGRITLRRYYTLVQDDERVTKDADGNVTSTKTVEVRKRIMDKECALDVNSGDIINLEYNLDALKTDKAAQQSKNVRILFKVDNSMYGVLSKQWEELGASNGCQDSSHLSKWQHLDHVLPNLLYRPELVKSSGLFNKLITDYVKNTYTVPVAVTFDLEALHERAKTADLETPSAVGHSTAEATADATAASTSEAAEAAEEDSQAAEAAEENPQAAEASTEQPTDHEDAETSPSDNASAPPDYPSDEAAGDEVGAPPTSEQAGFDDVTLDNKPEAATIDEEPSLAAEMSAVAEDPVSSNPEPAQGETELSEPELDGLSSPPPYEG